MKIAHTAFSINSSSGGIGPVVGGITESLNSVEKISTTTYVPTSGLSSTFPTNIESFRSIGPPQHCFSPGLVKQIEAGKNDLIHCHGIWTFLAKTNLDWGKKKPYLISPHGMTMPAAMKYSRWKKKAFWPFLEKPNLKNAKCIHALSQFEAQSIRALGIETPIVLIGNGVDIPESGVSQLDNTQFRNGTRTLLYLGRVHPIKGLEKLIDAWQVVQSNRLNASWRLQIVGWGDEQYINNLKASVSSKNLTSSIEFTGPLYGEEKNAAMLKAHAFVLPSSSEAFPMALMEAWSFGLPAVATNTCNVLGNKGEDLSFFCEDTADAIAAEVMLLIAKSDDERQILGDNLRKFVSANHSWPTVANKFAKTYRWLLDQGELPAVLTFE